MAGFYGKFLNEICAVQQVTLSILNVSFLLHDLKSAWLLYGTVEVLVDKTEEVNNDFNSKLEQLNEIMDTDFYADFIPTPFMISASFYPSWVISMVSVATFVIGNSEV